MFVCVSFLLLIVKIIEGLECITNCNIKSIPFDQSFQIGDDQCQERISKSSCSIDVQFFYGNRTYSVEFIDNDFESDDFLIKHNDLIYGITYRCSQQTNCVISYVQHRIRDMTSRSYPIELIWSEIEPYLNNSSQINSFQCFNTNNQSLECLNGYCTLSYDTIDNQFHSRSCNRATWRSLEVFFFDMDTYTSLDICCGFSLCNTMTTYTNIKNILVKYGLIDSNGRKIGLAIKQTSSYVLITFTLMFITFFK